MFIDESKRRGLFVAAACFDVSDLDAARRAFKELLMSGQERLHCTKESDARRRAIVGVVEKFASSLVVVSLPQHAPLGKARDACLDRLVEYAAEHAVQRAVIEADEGSLKADSSAMYRATRSRGEPGWLGYDWKEAKQEPLLWAADAVAWSWAKGGQWRRALVSIVEYFALDWP